MTFAILALGAVRACKESEVFREEFAELPATRLTSGTFPWGAYPHLITRVTQFRRAYDIDSSDLIAHFYFEPKEATELVSKLQAPSDEILRSHRCTSKLSGGWASPRVCDAEFMKSSGFVPYFRRRSLCPAGCWHDSLLWVKAGTGEAYLLGAPHYP